MKVLVTTAVFKSMMGCMGRGGTRVWVPVARGESISINNSPLAPSEEEEEAAMKTSIHIEE